VYDTRAAYFGVKQQKREKERNKKRTKFFFDVFSSSLS